VSQKKGGKKYGKHGPWSQFAQPFTVAQMLGGYSLTLESTKVPIRPHPTLKSPQLGKGQASKAWKTMMNIEIARTCECE